MSGGAPPHRRAFSLALVAAAIAVSGCTEVEEASVDGYEPAHLEEVEGSEAKQVTFTREGAARTGLQTATVRRKGRHRVVPYTALIYDGDGKSWVYSALGPLTFMRTAVQVARVDGDRVLITDGPPADSEVVTVGSTEVYGAELEIGGSH